MVRILKTRPVMRSLTFDGRQVIASEITTDEPLAGDSDKTHVAVDVAGNDNFPAYTVGFHTKADAKKFITGSGAIDFKGNSHGGDPVINRRVGLGIPAAMVADFDGDETELAKGKGKKEPEVVTSGPATAPNPSSTDPSAVATAPHATRENAPASQPGSDGSGDSSGSGKAS